MTKKEQIEKLLKELEEEKRLERKDGRKVLKEIRKSMSYDWHVDIVSMKKWCYRMANNGSNTGIRVQKKADAESVAKLHEFRENYPDVDNVSELMQPYGMVYYRTKENILINTGGGTYVLDVPRLCSDEQWERLKKGDVSGFER